MDDPHEEQQLQGCLNPQDGAISVENALPDLLNHYPHLASMVNDSRDQIVDEHPLLRLLEDAKTTGASASPALRATSSRIGERQNLRNSLAGSDNELSFPRQATAGGFVAERRFESWQQTISAIQAQRDSHAITISSNINVQQHGYQRLDANSAVAPDHSPSGVYTLKKRKLIHGSEQFDTEPQPDTIPRATSDSQAISGPPRQSPNMFTSAQQPALPNRDSAYRSLPSDYTFNSKQIPSRAGHVQLPRDYRASPVPSFLRAPAPAPTQPAPLPNVKARRNRNPPRSLPPLERYLLIDGVSLESLATIPTELREPLSDWLDTLLTDRTHFARACMKMARDNHDNVIESNVCIAKHIMWKTNVGVQEASDVACKTCCKADRPRPCIRMMRTDTGEAILVFMPLPDNHRSSDISWQDPRYWMMG